jgi:serine/threonine protein kinase
LSRNEKSGKVVDTMTFQTTKILREEEGGVGAGSPSREFCVGTVLWGRYEVTAVLGSSELGELWCCLDQKTGNDVTLRWLPPDLRRSKPIMAFIHAGIRRISDQTHSNVAAVRQVIYVGDQVYLVGDYAPGMNLSVWAKEGTDGKRSLQEVLPVLRQVAHGLDFAHANRVIHQNLKPSEIYLDSDGTARVTRFGLTPYRHMGIVHGAAVRIGNTGAYLAPELKVGDDRGWADSASDQYALAILAWELLAGKAPADAADDMPSELPNSARSALQRALSTHPWNRYVNCCDFVRALGGERVTSRRGHTVKEWRRIRIRTAVAVGTVSLCAGVYFGGQALINWMNRPPVQEERVAPKKSTSVTVVTKAEPEFVPPPPLIVTTPLPVEGSSWVTRTGRMEFIWVFDMQMWVGRYEVTNDQYKRKNLAHDCGEFEGLCLSGSLQPVVRVNFKDCMDYADWLTQQERAAGKLPEGWRYRLPSRTEAVTYTKAGLGQPFPWGANFPPTRGNYADTSYAKAFPSKQSIPGYQDGFAVTAPVDRSGENSWGLYGAGGNVWETVTKTAGSKQFGGWQGGGWDDYQPVRIQSKVAYGFIGNARGAVNGFRLVLGRIADEVPATAPKKER